MDWRAGWARLRANAHVLGRPLDPRHQTVVHDRARMVAWRWWLHVPGSTVHVSCLCGRIFLDRRRPLTHAGRPITRADAARISQDGP